MGAVKQRGYPESKPLNAASSDKSLKETDPKSLTMQQKNGTWMAEIRLATHVTVHWFILRNTNVF